MASTRGDLFTRIRSDIKSRDVFYTDSNSFTMMKRMNRYPDRSIASNYYPLTSSMYIDDERYRLTLLTAQPLGKWPISIYLYVVLTAIIHVVLTVWYLHWCKLFYFIIIVGATSIHEGDIEVMLDRRHDTHDHGGVSDSLLDNKPVILQFILLAERVDNSVSLSVLLAIYIL